MTFDSAASHVAKAIVQESAKVNPLPAQLVLDATPLMCCRGGSDSDKCYVLS